MKEKFQNLFHHLIAHPITGILYFFGFQKLGDYIHENY